MTRLLDVMQVTDNSPGTDTGFRKGGSPGKC